MTRMEEIEKLTADAKALEKERKKCVAKIKMYEYMRKSGIKPDKTDVERNKADITRLNEQIKQMHIRREELKREANQTRKFNGAFLCKMRFVAGRQARRDKEAALELCDAHNWTQVETQDATQDATQERNT